jgi:hypothetical protein
MCVVVDDDAPLNQSSSDYVVKIAVTVKDPIGALTLYFRV